MEYCFYLHLADGQQSSDDEDRLHVMDAPAEEIPYCPGDFLI